LQPQSHQHVQVSIPRRTRCSLLLLLQAQVEGGGVPQDTARDSAERTLAALTEQNQRLSSEKAAAEAQARDAAVCM
jgi:hypothetical protein